MMASTQAKTPVSVILPRILMSGYVVTVIAVFFALGLPSFMPQSLEVIDKDLYTQIQEETLTLTGTITTTQDTIDQVTGVNADPVDTHLTTAGQAWNAVWLTSIDLPVARGTTLVHECGDLVKEASRVLDPDQVLVSRLTTNDTSTPMIIADTHAQAIPSQLAECRTTLEVAIKSMNDTVAHLKNAAALTAAGTDNNTIRATLSTTVKTAKDTLASSKGKVQDDKVRVSLQEILTKAETALGAAPPSTWEDIDKDTATVKQLITDLQEATKTVTSAHNAWTKAHQTSTSSGSGSSSGGSSSSNKGGSSSSNKGGSSSSGGSSSGGSSKPQPTPAAKVVITYRNVVDGDCRFGGYITENTSKTLYVGITGYPKYTDAYGSGFGKGHGWAYGIGKCPDAAKDNLGLLWAELR